jgi:hypothetical protein
VDTVTDEDAHGEAARYAPGMSTCRRPNSPGPRRLEAYAAWLARMDRALRINGYASVFDWEDDCGQAEDTEAHMVRSQVNLPETYEHGLPADSTIR